MPGGRLLRRFLSRFIRRHFDLRLAPLTATSKCSSVVIR
jgi:hypothetical protein